MPEDLESLLQKAREGSVLAASRLISYVENDAARREAIVRRIFPLTDHVPYIGVTGPPGVGKSTLVDKLIRLFRKDKQKVGVIAVDPTSPFSGGAILGDRIRMSEHAGDEGVFVRSMASRGSLGGLSAAAKDAGRVMEYAGAEVVLLETVGVGQVEMDVMQSCDTTVLVLMPQTGDVVQVMKAGVLEAADILVINKRRLPGADALQRELIALAPKKGAWQVPILPTEAVAGENVEELRAKIAEHQAYLGQEGRRDTVRRRQLLEEVRLCAKERLERLFAGWLEDQVSRDVLGRLFRREASPYEVAKALLEKLEGRPKT